MSVRKRSPRCPSIALEEAIQRIGDLYDKESKHAVAADAAAQGLGYKDAKSGAAKTMIASVSYYGLLKRGADGKLSVSSDFEKYKYAPDDDVKAKFINEWLKNPKVFGELIARYGDDFPSDAALKYELIEMGFKPDAAEDALNVLKRSVDFVKSQGGIALTVEAVGDEEDIQDDCEEVVEDKVVEERNPDIGGQRGAAMPNLPASDFKTVTIFLPEGREALLYVPRPFYKKDKVAIKRQLNALLADDEDWSDDEGTNE